MLPHIVIKIPYFTVFLYKIPLTPIPLGGVYDIGHIACLRKLT